SFWARKPESDCHRVRNKGNWKFGCARWVNFLRRDSSLTKFSQEYSLPAAPRKGKSRRPPGSPSRPPRTSFVPQDSSGKVRTGPSRLPRGSGQVRVNRRYVKTPSAQPRVAVPRSPTLRRGD